MASTDGEPNSEVSADEPQKKKFKPSNNESEEDKDSISSDASPADILTTSSIEYSELMTFPTSVLEGTGTENNSVSDSNTITESESSPEAQSTASDSDSNSENSDSDDQAANELGKKKKSADKNRKSLDPDSKIEDTQDEETANKTDTECNNQEEGAETEEKSASHDSTDDIEASKAKLAKKKKKAIQRKDIRKIMSLDKLDEETLAAQREEAERLQRMMQKQQNLKSQSSSSSGSLLPITIEDVVRRMATNGITLSLSDLCSDSEDILFGTPDVETESKIEEEFKPEVQTEPEVFTLSSDDEDSEVVSASNRINYSADEPTIIDYNFCKSSGGVVYTRNTASIISLDEDEPFMNDKFKDEDSSDDDCVVISPPPFDDQHDPIGEKDEDENNKPDEFGRIVVNVGHPEDEEDIFLAPHIARVMKPHQIGGIRFLYDNVVESLDRFEKSAGFGCILAHSMGLGKTIQAAAFCEIFLRCTSAKTVLLIVPINTIQNWSHEFNHWLPTEVNTAFTSGMNYTKRKASLMKKEASSSDNMNGTINSVLSDAKLESDQENSTDQNLVEQSEVKSRKLNLFVLNETFKTLGAREKIISEWEKEGGVLLIGYEMYRMLALKKLKKNSKKKPFEDAYSHLDLTNEQDELLSKIHTCLVRPGPDLVICDEGHRIKNSGASISQALKAIRTRRRVVLTGYPLQNNLLEYWCMVDFIRPNYLGTKAEFSNMFERPISNGQCADSTPQDKRLMQFRSHVLYTLLQGFVQRRSHVVLQRALPPKQEFVFLVKMSPIQYRLYKEYISYIQLQVDMGHSTPNPIKAFAVCSKLWNHPDVLYKVLKKKQSVLLDDLELEDLAEVKKIKKKSKLPFQPSDYHSNSSPSSDTMFNGRECYFTGEAENSRRETRPGQDSLLSLEWASSAFSNYVPGVLENGTKFELLFGIIDETIIVGDKLLIFSQSLLTLDLMETFLHAKYGWSKGHEYFRLDGSTGGLERERLINEFNGEHKVHVFLVSTKAGSLGVNLIGANRVVVFDASWNPCHDCQAVCRIYRYGQKKQCQIYRFVTDYTLEKQIYDRQIHKGGMSNRVVDEMNPDSHFNARELLSTLLLEIHDLEQSQKEVIVHDVTNYSDSVIRTVLTNCGNKITRRPFEHESLLIDRKEKKLSAAERRMALRNYEMEKKAAASYSNGTGSGRSSGNSSGGITYPMLGKPFPFDESDSWNSSSHNPQTSSSTYQNYSFGGGTVEGGIPSKPSGASVRPYHREMYDHRSVSMVPDSRPSGSSMNWPAVIDDLRRKGVLTTQLIVLKRNYVLPNPIPGSRDTYLKPGDTLELIRARKCSYIRLSSGQFMAMRRGSRGYSYLDTIPFSQQLSSNQVQIFLSSFLRPTSSMEQDPYRSFMYDSTPSIISNNASISKHRVSQSTLNHGYNFSRSELSPPVSFPLPATLPYGTFSNHQNLQVSSPISNSGGDVTIWRREQHENSTRLQGELIPDMELIQLSTSDSSQNSRKNLKIPNAHQTPFLPNRINLNNHSRVTANETNYLSSTSRPFPLSLDRPSRRSSSSIQQKKVPSLSSNFESWSEIVGSAAAPSVLQLSPSPETLQTHNVQHHFQSQHAETNHTDLNRLLETSVFNSTSLQTNTNTLNLPTEYNPEAVNVNGSTNQTTENDSTALNGFYEVIGEEFRFPDYNPSTNTNNRNIASTSNQNPMHQYYNEDDPSITDNDSDSLPLPVYSHEMFNGE